MHWLKNAWARVACAMLLVTLCAIGAYAAAQSAEPGERVIKVVAQRFTYIPNEITLKKGEPVILEFETRDVLMGFNLPDFGARADIVPGKMTQLRLVPQKTGSFLFACDIFCGVGHEEMNGKVVVVE